MSNLDFVTDGTIERLAHRRQHRQDVLRECFRRKIDLIANDTEEMVDRCRDMMRGGFDVSEELKELETLSNSLQLVVLLMKRQAEAGATT